MGGIENPLGIRGLQVAVIPRSDAPFFLSPEQEADLKTKSAVLHGGLLTSLSEPFELPACHSTRVYQSQSVK